MFAAFSLEHSKKCVHICFTYAFSSLAFVFSIPKSTYAAEYVVCCSQNVSRADSAAALVVTFGVALVSTLAATTISGALKPGILNAEPTTLPAMVTFTAAAIAVSSANLVTLLLARSSTHGGREETAFKLRCFW